MNTRSVHIATTSQTVNPSTRPTNCSDAEWQLRVQLAAAYRLVDYFGWTELIYGHLTARLPGAEDHFLINPWGLNYDEITASNLVKVDVNGKAMDTGPQTINYAGFIIHSALGLACAILCPC